MQKIVRLGPISPRRAVLGQRAGLALDDIAEPQRARLPLRDERAVAQGIQNLAHFPAVPSVGGPDLRVERAQIEGASSF